MLSIAGRFTSGWRAGDRTSSPITSAAAAQTSQPVKTVWVSDLDISLARQGWGKPQANRSVDGHRILVTGQKFDHGFGTHSIGRLVIDLYGTATRFTARVGIDDDAKPGYGTAVFSVIGDGKEMFNSGILHRGDAAKPIDLDLRGIRQLQLRVGDAGDGFENDHADWADARIAYDGPQPVAIPIVTTQPTISMETAAGAVHIRPVPPLTGVAGQDVVLSIPTAGSGPMKFTAQGLPSGLLLDASTGMVHGTMPAQASQVMISVSSPSGSDSATLGILPGNRVALTPPMGWNSYDAYGDSVTEAEMLANARVLADRFRQLGWQYVVVDYRWYDPGAFNNDPNSRAQADLTMDHFGRLLPSPNRFPSATGGTGFKALADQIHSMGLRFGIHLMRGIPRLAVRRKLSIEGAAFTAADAADESSTCPWCPDMFGVRGDTAAGQAYYDSLFRLYAGWGVDYVKVDDLSQPYSTNEVAAIRRAIDRCGRAMVFSTSPGPAPLSRAQHLKDHANLWRATNDFWDSWPQLSAAMDVCGNWNGHGGPGHWPDMDMLPLGHLSVHHRSVGADRMTLFTHADQLTLLSLWSLFPSPLMIGGDLTQADDWEIALLNNEEVLAINQDLSGKPAMRVFNHGGKEVWQRELADGSTVVGLFNRTEDDDTVTATWADLDLAGRYAVRNLWLKKDAPAADGAISMTIPAHSAQLFLLRKF